MHKHISMKITTWVAAVALALGGVLAGTTAAQATTGGNELVEVYWAMPDGGPPNRVTWPQTHSPEGAVQCGVWYQVDTYKQKDADTLTADGILTNGEDHSVVISWRFEYGGDCIPPQPEPTVSYTDWQDGEWGCGDTEVTVSRERTEAPQVWDEASWSWIDGEPIVTTETRTRALTEAELKTWQTADPDAECFNRPEVPEPVTLVRTDKTDPVCAIPADGTASFDHRMSQGTQGWRWDETAADYVEEAPVWGAWYVTSSETVDAVDCEPVTPPVDPEPTPEPAPEPEPTPAPKPVLHKHTHVNPGPDIVHPTHVGTAVYEELPETGASVWPYIGGAFGVAALILGSVLTLAGRRRH